MTDSISLQARHVFPVVGKPISGGVVTVSADRIVSVGSGSAERPVRDLGDVAIIPGLVNAHTHLEFSHLDEPLGYPGIGMTEWIGRVIESRSGGEVVAADSVRKGVRESIAAGVTSLGEIAQPGWPTEVLRGCKLDVTIFLELIGPTEERVGAAVENAVEHLDATLSTGCTWRAGLSPHAPYSVHPRLLEEAVSLSTEHRIPLSFHLAESREEIELLRSGTGPFRELLEKLGAWDAGALQPRTRPLDYLRALAPAHRVLVVHGNYLDDAEIAYLGEHSHNMSVVYCPRTHAFFKHDDYPLAQLLAAGATVAFGTDSRASSPDLGILPEIRQAAQEHPDVSPAKILEMATLGGAKALGVANQTGSLEPGKYADLAVVSLPDDASADPYELLFADDAAVVSGYRRGQIIKNLGP